MDFFLHGTQWLELYDKDGDKAVTEEEYLVLGSGSLAMWKLLDSDADGCAYAS